MINLSTTAVDNDKILVNNSFVNFLTICHLNSSLLEEDRALSYRSTIVLCNQKGASLESVSYREDDTEMR